MNDDTKSKPEAEAEEHGDGLVRVGGVPLSKAHSDMLIEETLAVYRRSATGEGEETGYWGNDGNWYEGAFMLPY